MVKTSEHDLSYDEIYEELQRVAQECAGYPGVDSLEVRRDNGAIIVEFHGDSLPEPMRRALSYVDVYPTLITHEARFEIQDR